MLSATGCLENNGVIYLPQSSSEDSFMLILFLTNEALGEKSNSATSVGNK